MQKFVPEFVPENVVGAVRGENAAAELKFVPGFVLDNVVGAEFVPEFVPENVVGAVVTRMW